MGVIESAVLGPVAAAFVAGLGGSLHCVGMCGGIAGALAMRHRAATGATSLRAVMAHHIGRLASYAFAGAVVGSTGAALETLVGADGFGPWLRVGAGALIVLFGLRLALRWNPFAPIERAGGRFWAQIAPFAGRLASGRGVLAPLALGALWGFLPCGLIYSMLLLAALSASMSSGALVMVAFGIGTLPSMLTSSLLSARAGHWFAHRAWRGVAALVLVVFGVATAAIPLWHSTGPDARSHAHRADHATAHSH